MFSRGSFAALGEESKERKLHHWTKAWRVFAQFNTNHSDSSHIRQAIRSCLWAKGHKHGQRYSTLAAE
jgi:hypothetical protein